MKPSITAQIVSTLVTCLVFLLTFSLVGMHDNEFRKVALTVLSIIFSVGAYQLSHQLFRRYQPRSKSNK